MARQLHLPGNSTQCRAFGVPPAQRAYVLLQGHLLRPAEGVFAHRPLRRPAWRSEIDYGHRRVIRALTRAQSAWAVRGRRAQVPPAPHGVSCINLPRALPAVGGRSWVVHYRRLAVFAQRGRTRTM